MMTQQKTETELTELSIQHIQAIIQFLSHSTVYKHQTVLIKKLQGMLNKVQDDLTHGNNQFKSKGTTAEKRTTEWLKIAISHLGENGWKTSSTNQSPAQEKATLIHDCMESIHGAVISAPVARIPEDTIPHGINDYLTNEDRIRAVKASPTFFKAIWTPERLLSAVFMGEEDLACEIVRTNPALLFKSATYKMPILNKDGTSSTESEQIYHHITPLQLMLYTGDWKMWERLFPLIPEDKLEATLKERQTLTRGGPDLVKIDRDPATLSIAELQHYHVKDDDENPMYYPNGDPVLDDLLHNRNGLFYREIGDQDELFLVNIDPDTGEKEVRKLIEPQNMIPADKEVLNQFKEGIKNDIAMNSSLRTSDAQHALIKRLFGVTLERNGIHYTLNGQDYHDTYDGCIRLKNAYRKYIEIYDAHQANTPWNAVDAAWPSIVGMAQRQAMVHVIQRFCEEDKPFYPLQKANELKSRVFVRTLAFDNLVTLPRSVLPARINSEVGFNFGLYKGVWLIARVGRVRLGGAPVGLVDLAAIRLIDEVRKACFNERMHELDQRLHPSQLPHK